MDMQKIFTYLSGLENSNSREWYHRFFVRSSQQVYPHATV